MAFPTRAKGPEILDSQDVGPETFARVMDDLAAVSRVMLAHAPTLGFLRRATRNLPPARAPIRILDAGSGEGDLLRHVWRWAERRDIAVQLLGIDLNARSADLARARTPAAMKIEYRTGDIFEHREPTDFVVSSLFTHHLDDAQAVEFLRWMERHAECGWFVNDLHRHAFAYHSFGLLARVARWHRIVRLDGQMSVARAFRVGEWRALLDRAGVNARLRWRPMFRLCVERIKVHSGV